MLLIPTSVRNAVGTLTGRAAQSVAKGQLYNLDTDEFLSFQFNPESFEWERRTKWAEITHKGDDTGGDLQFLNIGPRTFDLDLLYMADPGAPGFEYQVAPPLKLGSDNGLKMDFAGVRAMIESWEAVIPAYGRPSRIKVIMGDNWFAGVITQSRFRLSEFFTSNLKCREAEISLEFREWQL